jgi:hypothetical protein
MISEAALRGYLLEEALAWVLHDVGYRLLVYKSQDPDGLEDRSNGLCVKGRGAEHQVDVLGEFIFTPPFSLPIRLFLEAKFASHACRLPVIRNAHGVIHDINEGFGRASGGSSRKRYRYEYALFSTSGFTKDAQDFANAQQICLVDLSTDSCDWLRESVQVAARELLALQERLQIGIFPVRWIRCRLRVMLDIMPDLPSENFRYPELDEPVFDEQASLVLRQFANDLRSCQPGEVLLDSPFTQFSPTKVRSPDNSSLDKNTQVTPKRNKIAGADSPINRESEGRSAPPPTGRPYWQDKACPPWCLMSVPHQDHDLADDRFHMSAFYHVDLTLEDARSFRDLNGKLLSCEPAFLTVQLYQHYRDRDPQVTVTRNGEVDIPFTIIEAEEMAQVLASLKGQAANSQLLAQGNRCPSWCTVDPHEVTERLTDRIHMSDYLMVTLGLDEPYFLGLLEARQADKLTTVQPQLIGIRLEQSWGEFEARIVIVYRDDYLSMTLTEAQEIAEALTELTKASRLEVSS